MLDVPDEPMPLFADPTRAEQIIANLLTNAAKYTHEGGRIDRPRLCATTDEAVIKVIDTGIGLPPEMLGRVFDLFAQADRTLDRSEGGLGIGLTVARKLAEMHGGTISAASEGLGQGADVHRAAAAQRSARPTSESHARAASPTAISAKLRILVVDDNRDTATSCAHAAESVGPRSATRPTTASPRSSMARIVQAAGRCSSTSACPA